MVKNMDVEDQGRWKVLPKNSNYTLEIPYEIIVFEVTVTYQLLKFSFSCFLLLNYLEFKAAAEKNYVIKFLKETKTQFLEKLNYSTSNMNTGILGNFYEHPDPS